MKKLGFIIAVVILSVFIQGCSSKQEVPAVKKETMEAQKKKEAEELKKKKEAEAKKKAEELKKKKEAEAKKKKEKVISNSKYYSVNTSTTSTLEDTVDAMATQLLETMTIKPNLEAIAITSFVDLHQLNKTTYFGRVVAESFFNDLHRRGLMVADFRGQKTLVVNADGEFFISRDVKKLNTTVTTKYVLVGTYSKIEEGVIINARIIDNQTGVVMASSRVVHHSISCEIFENCTKEDLNKKTVTTSNGSSVQKRTIGLSTDGCSSVECPKNCTTLECNENRNIKTHNSDYDTGKIKLLKKKFKYCGSKQYRPKQCGSK